MQNKSINIIFHKQRCLKSNFLKNSTKISQHKKIKFFNVLIIAIFLFYIMFSHPLRTKFVCSFTLQICFMNK